MTKSGFRVIFGLTLFMSCKSDDIVPPAPSHGGGGIRGWVGLWYFFYHGGKKYFATLVNVYLTNLVVFAFDVRYISEF